MFRMLNYDCAFLYDVKLTCILQEQCMLFGHTTTPDPSLLTDAQHKPVGTVWIELSILYWIANPCFHLSVLFNNLYICLRWWNILVISPSSIFPDEGQNLIHRWIAGSDGIDKIFSPKHSTSGSAGSIRLSPSPHLICESPRTNLEATLASLEDAVTDSQAKCATLTADVDGSESSIQDLETVKQLGQTLESMQSLLARLRTQI